MDFLYNNPLTTLFTTILHSIAGSGLGFPIAIIILTVIIRFALFPVDKKQRDNSKKMAALGPELQSIQKRYANDPQRMQQKQQELYKKTGVNPFMGCLPALITLPLWFAFFGAMRVLSTDQMVSFMLTASHFGAQTVTMPSMLWVHNFWQPDTGFGFGPILPTAAQFISNLQSGSSGLTPQILSILQHQDLVSFQSGAMAVGSNSGAVYEKLSSAIISNAGLTGFQNGWFILPVLSGLSLFLQQKFGGFSDLGSAGGTTPQPGQAGTGKFMLWFFPLFSVYICCTSPASFALYWTVSSAYAFAQAKVVDALWKKRKTGEITVQNK
ncbi:MAG: YidC/Oxa1 family membrane protein insertase [Eubacteriales bacterium]